MALQQPKGILEIGTASSVSEGMPRIEDRHYLEKKIDPTAPDREYQLNVALLIEVGHPDFLPSRKKGLKDSTVRSLNDAAKEVLREGSVAISTHGRVHINAVDEPTRQKFYRASKPEGGTDVGKLVARIIDFANEVPEGAGKTLIEAAQLTFNKAYLPIAAVGDALGGLRVVLDVDAYALGAVISSMDGPRIVCEPLDQTQAPIRDELRMLEKKFSKVDAVLLLKRGSGDGSAIMAALPKEMHNTIVIHETDNALLSGSILYFPKVPAALLNSTWWAESSFTPAGTIRVGVFFGGQDRHYAHDIRLNDKENR